MTPRNEEQNKQIRDERKQQILKAALKVFARRGLTATKISEIASEAGLSHGLVYHYFSSKDEIFTILVDMALEGSSKVIGYAAQQNVSPLEQLRWLTETILKELPEDGAYYTLIIIQAFTSDAVPDSVKAILNSKSPSSLEAILPIIIAGQQADQIVQVEPAKLADQYFALIQGFAIQQVQKTKSFGSPDVDLILRLFKK